MKIKSIILLSLVLGLVVVAGTSHAQKWEKFWALSVGNIHILDGTSLTGAFQWQGEIIGTDSINLVDTYILAGSWRDAFKPAWQPDNRSWFSIINPFEMRVMANSEYDEIGLSWHSVILDPPGMLWFRNPIVLGDSWPISSTGMLTAGAAPLGNELINTPITVTGTVSVLAVETIAAPLGTYRAYKIQHQIEIRNQSNNNIIEAATEQDWFIPYLGNVKWADGQSTELLSSLTLPFLFSDTPSTYWAYHYIAAIYNNGITGGCGNPFYCPGSNVTREQMAAFLVRAREGGPAYEGACLGPSPFNDVPQNSIFCRNIERLVELGITSGCAAGMYCPGDNVTREQMAAFIVRAVEGGQFYEGPCDGASPFSDVPQGSPFCKNIERLVNRGTTAGCAAGTYCPGNNVFRDQMAAFLARAFLGSP
jgi:hypothetical protein